MTQEKKEDKSPKWNAIVQAEDGFWFEIGVGWDLPNGGISVRFNPILDLSKVPASGFLIKPRHQKKEDKP